MKKVFFAFFIPAIVLTMAFMLVACPTDSENPPTYDIGDNGPAGGLIFYVEDTGGGGYTYYEAAPEDCAGTDGAEWGASEPADTGAAIGTGKANTAAMLAGNPADGTAAKLCSAYRGGGKDDWFLPSNLELKAMKENLHKAGKGSFANVGYWSSTGFRGRYANGWDFGEEGAQGYTQGRSSKLRVRAARTFN
jgi:hypothetical protein